MPKNKGAGGKNKRKGKNTADEESKRELLFKEEGQEYAQVLKMLGGSQVEAHCFDDIKRKCHIRGKMTKKVWINVGDIILIGTRDYEKNVGDVIHKYMPQEVRNLKAYGEIPDNVKVDDETHANTQGDQDDVIFDDDN